MLSFIIPAYNGALLRGRTIQSIHDAARALGVAYEIVVADDASTDRTPEIAAAGGARVVTVSNRQIAATRNAGARAAGGDRFVFIFERREGLEMWYDHRRRDPDERG